MCLTNLQNPAEYLKLLRIPIIVSVIFLGLTISYVGDFLSLSPEQMISTMFLRIFLSNDGRALAIDFASILNHGGSSLFQEAFRGLASTLGSPSVNMPLGQLLYQEAFNTVGLTGANTSSTELLIAYGGEMEKALFVIVLLMMLSVLVFVARAPGNYLFPRLVLGFSLVILLSQDILAFQSCINILVALIIILFLFLAFSHVVKLSIRKMS